MTAPRRSWVTAGIFAAAALLSVAYAIFAVSRSADRVEEQKQTVVTEQALADVADPLAKLCEEDPAIKARVGAACTTAAQAVSAPPERGADGLNGRNGIDGRAGVDGAAGVSPPCLVEPSRCQGKDGSNGTNGTNGTDGTAGKDGVDGRDGANGSPATEMIVNRTDGSSLRCPRTGGGDSAPVYTCSPA